ncbi:MAG: glycosyltransferase [Kiloniellaceae bacterium]
MASGAMIRVHVLTDRMSSHNTRAFLIPLLRNRGRLQDLGIALDIFYRVEPALRECDAIMVNEKYYGARWRSEAERILEELEGFAAATRAVLYCDIRASTGLIRADVLPRVTLYLKSQLLRDRSLYAKSFYGGRIFTDYYHRTAGVIDSRPQYSSPVTDPAQLKKLRISWNMGLVNYRVLGSRLATLYRHLPLKAPLHWSGGFCSPSTDRPQVASCRIGTSYDRETVAHQRLAIRDALRTHVATKWVSRREYLRELTRSKVAVSPFGWGEYTVRDYEAFLCGALLLKPDMSHLETYPDFYQDGKTMVAHRWDLCDLEEKLEIILADYDDYVTIAQAGQELYRHHFATREGREEFACCFHGIVADALNG